jgi:hypothetical protein
MSLNAAEHLAYMHRQGIAAQFCAQDLPADQCETTHRWPASGNTSLPSGESTVLQIP